MGCKTWVSCSCNHSFSHIWLRNVLSGFAENSVESGRPASSFSTQPWHSCHKLIYVRPNPKTGVPVGHWPIPESFWPDQNSPTLVRDLSCIINLTQDCTWHKTLPLSLFLMSVCVLCRCLHTNLLFDFHFVFVSLFYRQSTVSLTNQ